SSKNTLPKKRRAYAYRPRSNQLLLPNEVLAGAADVKNLNMPCSQSEQQPIRPAPFRLEKSLVNRLFKRIAFGCQRTRGGMVFEPLECGFQSLQRARCARGR